jgi:tripartite-type tricarboxylate transporter receptor subunit TctC
MRGMTTVGLLLTAAGWGIAAPALAQEDFFKGKTITVLIGYAPGGTYDATARLLSRHMPHHLAGQPTMIPQNMAGEREIRPDPIQSDR